MNRRDLPRYDLTLLRGDTFVSEQFWFPEDVGPDWQLWQIEEGVGNLSCDLLDWRQFEIKAQVISDGKPWFTLSDYLQYSELGRFFWFALSAEETRNLSPSVGVYDLQICKDGYVQTLMYGTVKLLPDITDTPC
ncbi:hypothetical protein [Endozoicomonas acroporae]|uniref:hypothetical protein n=1 Tax=Endozoicomonas acroporae TaxID=1701104 RepID=UPI003D7BEA77